MMAPVLNSALEVAAADVDDAAGLTVLVVDESVVNELRLDRVVEELVEVVEDVVEVVVEGFGEPRARRSAKAILHRTKVALA